MPYLCHDAELQALLKKLSERLKAGKRSKEIPDVALKPPDSYTLSVISRALKGLIVL